MFLLTTSVDDWLDEKRKSDGAEGLWRIHDKLYDLTVWSRSHPGGKFWIETTQGTDITEVFENHHLSPEAESLLGNFYKKEASSPRNSDVTFFKNGFFRRFKRKLVENYPEEIIRPSLSLKLKNDFLVVSVFLTGLLGVRYGILWKFASGLLLGLLAISSHTFLHSKDHWRVHYFDMSLMSSREWRIIHVLSHHQFRGTVSDLEIPVWRPFSKSREGLGKYLNFLSFPVAAHLQFIRRCLDVLLSRKLSFRSEEVIAFLFPFFLFSFTRDHPWNVFVTWNQIVLMGSFFYCFFGSISDKNYARINWKTNAQKVKDFGIVQLSLSGKQTEKNSCALSFLNSFRGNVLHYLCPGVECGYLSHLIPALDQVINECGISLLETDTGFLEGGRNAAS